MIIWYEKPSYNMICFVWDNHHSFLFFLHPSNHLQTVIFVQTFMVMKNWLKRSPLLLNEARTSSLFITNYIKLQPSPPFFPVDSNRKATPFIIELNRHPTHRPGHPDLSLPRPSRRRISISAPTPGQLARDSWASDGVFFPGRAGKKGKFR